MPTSGFLRRERKEVRFGGRYIHDLESDVVQHLFDQRNVEHVMMKGSVLKILQASLSEMLEVAGGRVHA